MTKREKITNHFTIKHFDNNELTAMLFYLFLGIISGARGITFLMPDENHVESILWFLALENVMGIKIWGAILIILSIMLILSILTASTPNYILTAISNAALALVFIGLGAAGLEYGIPLWTLFVHIILATAHAMLAVIGGRFLWIKKKKMNT